MIKNLIPTKSLLNYETIIDVGNSSLLFNTLFMKSFKDLLGNGFVPNSISK